MIQQTVEELGHEFGRKAAALPREARTKLVRTMANWQLREIRNNFRKEEDPSGAPWPGLSPATLANRKSKGRMLRGANDPVQLVRSVEVDAESIRIGTNDPILGIHHTGAQMRVTRKQSVWMYYNLFGGEGPPGPFGMVGKTLRIPRRRGIGFGPGDADEHAEIAARWLEKGFA